MTAVRMRLLIPLLLSAMLVVLLINPVGFMGGPRDDARYLEAARCWVEHGPCLPTNHWQGRWPVFLPIAILISVFGESRAVVQLWPLVCSTAALLIFARVAQHLFGDRIALVAGFLLLCTPAFAIQLLRPNVETIELFLVLGAIACTLKWRDRGHGKWAFAAGLGFGLAWQVRETSVFAAVIVAGAMLALGHRPKLTHIIYAAVGFALPLAAELLIFELTAGDWLHRRRLSLSHATIPSGELPSWIDRTRSPILNPDYIANWRRERGVHIHWLIDGPINLLMSPLSGFSLLIAPVLLLAGKDWMTPSRRRMGWWLLAMAAIYICFLTYVLAIDPKSRIMLIPLALGSLALAVAISSLIEHDRKSLAIAVCATIGLSDVLIIASVARMGWAERQARVWIAKYPDAIKTNDFTRSILTLNSDVRALPGLDAKRRFVMILTHTSCHKWPERYRRGAATFSVADKRRLNPLPESIRPSSYICLFDDADGLTLSPHLQRRQSDALPISQ